MEIKLFWDTPDYCIRYIQKKLRVTTSIAICIYNMCLDFSKENHTLIKNEIDEVIERWNMYD